jgi:hypothetical protein
LVSDELDSNVVFGERNLGAVGPENSSLNVLLDESDLIRNGLVDDRIPLGVKPAEGNQRLGTVELVESTDAVQLQLTPSRQTLWSIRLSRDGGTRARSAIARRTAGHKAYYRSNFKLLKRFEVF